MDNGFFLTLEQIQQADFSISYTTRSRLLGKLQLQEAEFTVSYTIRKQTSQQYTPQESEFSRGYVTRIRLLTGSHHKKQTVPGSFCPTFRRPLKNRTQRLVFDTDAASRAASEHHKELRFT